MPVGISVLSPVHLCQLEAIEQDDVTSVFPVVRNTVLDITNASKLTVKHRSRGINCVSWLYYAHERDRGSTVHNERNPT